jgi:hypothetical protein
MTGRRGPDRRTRGGGKPAGDPPEVGAAAAIPEGAAADHGRDAAGPRRLFVVSVSEDPGGELQGVVEAVRSGRKERFQGLDTLGAVVGALFRRLRDDVTKGRP